MNLDRIKKQIANITTAAELEKIRVELLGRNGLLNKLFSEIKTAPNPKQYGATLNQQKKEKW